MTKNKIKTVASADFGRMIGIPDDDGHRHEKNKTDVVWISARHIVSITPTSNGGCTIATISVDAMHGNLVATSVGVDEIFKALGLQEES